MSTVQVVFRHLICQARHWFEGITGFDIRASIRGIAARVLRFVQLRNTASTAESSPNSTAASTIDAVDIRTSLASSASPKVAKTSVESPLTAKALRSGR